MYTPHTFRTGAGAYARIGIETSAMSASPHQLISMLFEGAKAAIGMARHHMACGEIVAKGNAISKAIDIVASGLKAALDADAAGSAGEELVNNLSALYDYIVQKLFQANLRNDAGALDEAEELLESIGSAWREIDAAPARA
ncbi:flagellar protein FliS [Variovorax sp. HW608]|uniref:flagellar export chaperone FliS n=1 Tax=Variovorax sp. HW608 TaxID=1034889 RepID=UPI0008201664|nr:flagellar export chaperone FliS [Variovorax sp. HW608]SCK60176.1 flagellar protein FliS [Variovorax sp. HW608]